MGEITELLRKCTVKVDCGAACGTGFFVSPGHVVTCAHNVRFAHSESKGILVGCEPNVIEGILINYLPSSDIALLSVESQTHPCVYLDTTVELGDSLYAFGYPAASPGYGTYTNGDSLTVKYEGPSVKPYLLKLKMGQVVPGFSGAPALNLRTGMVCGMLCLTRDKHSDFGGRAIPTNVILKDVHGLAERQELFHSEWTDWRSLLPDSAKSVRSSGQQIVTNQSTVLNQTNIHEAVNVVINK